MKFITQCLFSFLISCTLATAHAQVITTVAGNGTGGNTGDGGPATDATIFPTAVTTDASGNFYMCVGGRIRKVSSTGIITTIAGGDTFGYTGDGGPATAALFNSIAGLAAGPSGELYVADRQNSCIRKIDASGGISTIAGTGTAGLSGDNGPAGYAMLNNPSGVATDAVGNIYIADNLNHLIRKINVAAGIIETIAGGGTLYGNNIAATDLSIGIVNGIAVSRTNEVYFTENSNCIVRKIAPTSIVTIVAGQYGAYGNTGNGGPATACKLVQPGSIAVDAAGNIYIAQLSVVRKVDAATGIIDLYAGSGSVVGDGGPATATQLKNVAGLATDASGRLYISDRTDARERRVSAPVAVISPSGGQAINMNVYPNPAHNGRFIINITSPVQGAAMVVLTDLSGRIVKTVTARLNEENSIDLSDAPGIYIVTADAAGRHWSSTIAVE